MRLRTPSRTPSSAAWSPSLARATSSSNGDGTLCCTCSISASNGTGRLGPEKDGKNGQFFRQGSSLGRKNVVSDAGPLKLREDVLGARVVRNDTRVCDCL